MSDAEVFDRPGLDRAAYDRAVGPARQAAYPPGQLVGQESLMLAGEILDLAARAGIRPGVRVLDMCCGAGGPGRLITAAMGCRYLGVDVDPTAVELARSRAGGLTCRYEVGQVPPLPAGAFDVVLLLETLLAFADKRPLLQAVREALVPGGRFAFTVEDGAPLTAVEKLQMPASDTVWPVPLATLVSDLHAAGFVVGRVHDRSRSHQRVARALAECFADRRATISGLLGARMADDLIASHGLWASWLATGRVRKLALVATLRHPASRPHTTPPERSTSW